MPSHPKHFARTRTGGPKKTFHPSSIIDVLKLIFFHTKKKNYDSMRKVDQQKSAFQSKKTQKNCFNLQIRNNHNSKKNSFSGEKSVNLAFLVEIRYCFFMYAPAEVSGRVQFLDRAQDIVH